MKSILIAIFVIFPTTISAHMCHDPFRPGQHLVPVPEKEFIQLEEKVDFRIFVENTFSSKLEAVQLFVENPTFEIDINPPILKKLLPGEKTFFSQIETSRGFQY
ncbi:MAG: hypothetical protein QME68_07375, partial [Elusimicrobiota bacterium]|nr:hypothetical protein [Elusimicrobiota bacterium]